MVWPYAIYAIGLSLEKPKCAAKYLKKSKLRLTLVCRYTLASSFVGVGLCSLYGRATRPRNHLNRCLYKRVPS